ncbi:hypothetical protein Rumeso_02522 [Rubellimicrobium mesophilum DSM 19309]|uniref:Uncharacterized protein n=1 Tax=Rubellimicrobium mesophilum DSM 19309 TaxID=442562 RepID=A0A017HQ60_9RHOB|nr:hypothetical protein Rumeso_02522 [Rubellimicrobium mesophilum DSM 19309]
MHADGRHRQTFALAAGSTRNPHGMHGRNALQSVIRSRRDVEGRTQIEGPPAGLSTLS